MNTAILIASISAAGVVTTAALQLLSTRSTNAAAFQREQALRDDQALQRVEQRDEAAAIRREQREAQEEDEQRAALVKAEEWRLDAFLAFIREVQICHGLLTVRARIEGTMQPPALSHERVVALNEALSRLTIVHRPIGYKARYVVAKTLEAHSRLGGLKASEGEQFIATELEALAELTDQMISDY